MTHLAVYESEVLTVLCVVLGTSEYTHGNC